MGASATNSNRRVRTRTHGGVAGVSGQPLPLCRSNAVLVQVPAQFSDMPARIIGTLRLGCWKSSTMQSNLVRTELSFAVPEVIIEASVEDWWIDINLLDLAAGGAELYWFRT